MTFRFIGSLKSAYFGVEINRTAYYVMYQSFKDCRFFGYQEEWYDGPIRTWGAWWFYFQIVY